MVKAVLFDMDGVLIDTERLNLKLMIEASKEFGFDVDPADILSLRSTAPEECAAFYRSKYGDNFDFYEIREARRKTLREYIEKNGLCLKTGVKETLDFLKENNVKTAVVTSTQYDRAANYIKMLKIENMFDIIVSTSLVERGKPYPDVYQYAAEKIGEKPEDCIAVEDSPNGVRSAYDAGCRVVVIPDLTEANEDMRQMGTWILDSMEELIDIVDELIN